MSQSEELAARSKDEQTPMGGAVTTAGHLRALRLDNPATSKKPGKSVIGTAEQVAFVLTDGGSQNPKHAVLRLHSQADRTIAKQIREKLVKAFEPYASWLRRQN